MEEVKEKTSDPRGQGALAFELVTSLLTGGSTKISKGGKLHKLLSKLDELPGGKKLDDILDSAAENRSIGKHGVGATGCFVAGTPVRVLVQQPAYAVSAWDDAYSAYEPESQWTEVAQSIETIQVGSRIGAINPNRDEIEPSVLGNNLQRIAIAMRHANGALVEVELLRPGRWAIDKNQHPGGGIDLWLTEIDVRGSGKVLSIEPFGELEQSSGRVVTGRFKTVRPSELVEVRFADGSRLAGTPNHPVWSLSANDWTGLGELSEGEQVQSACAGTGSHSWAYAVGHINTHGNEFVLETASRESNSSTTTTVDTVLGQTTTHKQETWDSLPESRILSIAQSRTVQRNLVKHPVDQ